MARSGHTIKICGRQVNWVGTTPTPSIMSFNDSIVLQLDKHRKEVVAMATADDLLVSTSKDADLITWSMKNKVDMY